MATPTNHPAAALRAGRRRRRVGAIGAAVAVTTMGSFAAAAVISTNEVQSDWELTSCLTKNESGDGTDFGGAPTDNFYINFDNTTTTTDAATGVAVLHETLSVKAPAGFITSSTDTFTVDAAGCGHDFTVRLVAAPTNTFGEAAVGGFWADKAVSLYLSEVAAPGDDFSVAADWDADPLQVGPTGAPATTGVIVDADTGTAILADNSSLTIGFELIGGVAAGAAAGELNFQVEFIPIP